MRPNKLILFLTAILATATLKAQDREAGIFLGTTQYQGDLSQKQITLNETKPAVGILMRYYFNPRVNFKGALNYGWIEGSDANYANKDYDRYKRNLSFKSHIIELTGQIELNILPYISNSKRYRFAPYVFAGASLYHFNPTTSYQGKTIDLQPLGTEGQTLPGGDGKYHRLQGAIPFGLGLKFSLGNFWNLAIEAGQRKLFTDYLDDVSTTYPDKELLAAQNPTAAAMSDRGGEVNPKFAYNKVGQKRGDSKDLDLYIFAGFTITKTIRRFSCTGF